MTDIERDDIRRLADLVRQSSCAVVFTGAGISTESGIPDFRSPGGVWDKMAPIYFDDFVNDPVMRKEAWRRRFAMEDMFSTAKPNAGHLAVAKLVERSKVSHVITQNIDNLHQASGVPAESVIELHGNTTYATCLVCSTRYEIAPLRKHACARRSSSAARAAGDRSSAYLRAAAKWAAASRWAPSRAARSPAASE